MHHKMSYHTLYMIDAHPQHDSETLRDLISQAKAGNTAAFEEIYTQYYTALYSYVLRRTGNPSDAEDVTQTVFLKFWNALPNFNESHTSPRAYMFTLARNTLIDLYRKSSHKEIVSDQVVSEHIENVQGVDSDTIARENKEIITQGLAHLSPEQKEIITLLYGDDLSYTEVATITGKKEDALRQIHSRALKKLRAYYEQQK